MLHRPFGTTGEQVSILGFGCMRLPVVGERHDRIDRETATTMLRRAIDAGVNYVDTAYPYHGTSHTEPGASEPFVGEALQGGYRERVLLATKLPSWLVKTRDDMDMFLDRQLERLQTDCIDCYLLHGLNRNTWQTLRELDVLDFLDSAVADGRIRYPGFSFHDEKDIFPPIVDSYEWAFCQIQYNYMDIDYQAGSSGLRYAADRGLGVIVMEPLRGGRLANRVPAAVQEVFSRAEARRSPTEWALRFVWDDPGVSLLLSGMSAPEHVEQNLAATDGAYPGTLTPDELRLYPEARAAYHARVVADCTECRYCLPCPTDIDIPAVLALLNDASIYDDPASARIGYQMSGGNASACTDCGQCEEECPQQLPVRELLAQAARLFE